MCNKPEVITLYALLGKNIYYEKHRVKPETTECTFSAGIFEKLQRGQEKTFSH